jgi:hypothetical protein
MWLKVVHGAGDETVVRALHRRLAWTEGHAADKDLWFIRPAATWSRPREVCGTQQLELALTLSETESLR